MKLTDSLVLPCGAILENRFGKSALTEGLGDDENHATDAHARLYERWSRGGAGLLLTGNIQVDRRYLERPGNVAIDGDRGLEKLEAYARASTVNGNHCWVQLNHPGRQVLDRLSDEPIAPSVVPMAMPGFNPPREMTIAEIEDVAARFATGAKLVKKAGFTGVQIHAAHGYLFSQFLSPRTNRRTDEYGGPIENRARALLETVRAIREAVGKDFPISVKLNSADFQDGGFDETDCLKVVAWLQDASLDLLEISGGNYESPTFITKKGAKESTVRREAYFMVYAAAIRAAAPRLPLMVTGGFRSRDVMEAALAQMDVVGLGRPLIVDPEGVNRIVAGEIAALPAPEDELRYQRAVFEKLGPELAFEAKMWSVQGWFCVQLLELGAGRDPNPNLELVDAFLRYRENENDATARVKATRRL